jgi:hypothetical protein
VDHLQHKFSRDDFNSAFEQYAFQQAPQPQTWRDPRDTAMVVRTEPEEMSMFQSTASSTCASLSVDKVDDFSSPFLAGSTAAGGYTDYMRAFSSESLITPHTAAHSAAGGAAGLSYQADKARMDQEYARLQRERDNLSFIPDPELLAARARQEAAQKEQDERRWREFMRHQEQVEAHQQAIRNVLSDRSDSIRK